MTGSRDGLAPGSARRRGVVLLLLSALLTFLVATAAIFLEISSRIRRISRSTVEGARAALLARSGVEYATARLAVDPQRKPFPARPEADWSYRDAASVQLQASLNPSYHVAEPWTDTVPDGIYTPADGWAPAQAYAEARRQGLVPWNFLTRFVILHQIPNSLATPVPESK